MRTRYAVAGFALATVGITLGLTSTIAADTGTSAIRGRLQEGGVGSHAEALVLVVPADAPQPVSVTLPLAEPGDGPLDSFMRIPTERSGPGLVRAGSAYGYGVRDLKPGRYFVGTTANFGGYGAILPPVEIETLVSGRLSSMYAFEVMLEADSTLMVNFEMGSQFPDAPGRFEVCAFTYDPITFEEGIPDRVTAATIAAVDDEGNTSGVAITINDNGCVQFDNVPRGEYIYTITTDGGFTLDGDLRVRGGEDGHIERLLGYVRLDGQIEEPGLPHSGNGRTTSRHVHLYVITLVTLMTFGIASVATAVRVWSREQ